MTTRLEAWIDVGGTFTDCFLLDTSAAQRLRKTKVLSSGRVPISVSLDGAANALPNTRLLANELASDPPEFWCGADVQVLDAAGQCIDSVPVCGFQPGELELERAPKRCEDARYELNAHVEAPVLGIRRMLGCPLTEPLPPISVRLGTTRGTNALLTRSGAKTALAITAPLEDLLAIGDQTRPELFALDIIKPQPLAGVTVPIDERLDASGHVLLPLDIGAARAALQRAYDAGCESLAICLMHSYLNPSHEQQLHEIAAQVGFRFISVSSQLAPLIEIVARAQTTVVDAYLGPIIRSYLAKLIQQLGGPDHASLSVMTSAGGLMPWQEFSGKDCILSGPAGGVVALRALAEATGQTTLIGLDMGGTSTDVCRVGDGEQLQYESTKAGVRILTPTLPIETVAAGGGSICWYDGVSLRVGPQSAGSQPGPACYGRGGPLTITDLNVYLGRIPPEQFPFPIDTLAIQQRLEEVFLTGREPLQLSSQRSMAEGFLRIACQQMAEAVRRVSTAQGIDPREHAIVGFGGAAGQHVCEVAELLGMRTVIDAQDAGLLSGLGMGLAERRCDDAIAVYKPLGEVGFDELESEITVRCRKLLSELAAESSASALTSKQLNSKQPNPSGETTGDSQTQGQAARTRVLAELRYAATETSLPVSWAPPAEMTDEFQRLHQQRFGVVRPGAVLEMVAVRIEATRPAAYQLPAAQPVATLDRHPNVVEMPESSEARPGQAMPVLQRGALQPGHQINGPAIIASNGSTLVIDRNWTGSILSDGTLELRYTESGETGETAQRPVHRGASTSLDPVLRDCFAQRLATISEQMGAVLQQTAISVNVKQRRDYSCAVFDSAGRLLASAAHVPVHLGAMGTTVRCMLSEFPEMAPGDCFITNDPSRGGSHLPDLTVVMPVFEPATREIAFFVANRAHHADVGGVSPGSMSVMARNLAEEGVVIPPQYLAKAGEDRSGHIASFMRSSRWPPRNMDEVLADLSAQRAAALRGSAFLSEYADSVGWQTLDRYSQHFLDAAEQRVRRFVAENFEVEGQARQLTAVDALDDGTPICVRASFPGGGQIVLDFTGTGPVSPLNFNANPSIVTAAALYVLRLMVADDLSLNEGVLRCIDLEIPSGVLNPPQGATPEECAAVAAGNVETSQRVVDVLLAAFGKAAGSQGTMNNFLFGNESFGFYETICGGAGATGQLPGASAVHTHMTNTRLTDPEILEARYPVRLTQFGIRRGSGGSGLHAGGDGVIRQVLFLESVELSLLTSRRGALRPPGLAGGQAGAAGINTRINASGAEEVLPASCCCTLAAGEQIRIETPGGGGYGSP